MYYKTIFEDLGLIEYKEALDYQQFRLNEIVKKRYFNNNTINYLLFCEHPHVFTIGKSGNPNNLLINNDFLKQINASYYLANRGGDITYHGPGQIVIYPIFDLKTLKIGIKDYIYMIEEVIIKTLYDYEITASRLSKATGVWLDVDDPLIARKICSIGVRVSKSITMHGLAFNINTDLSYFNYINPCGFTDKTITSLNKELNRNVKIEQVKITILKHFKKIFKLQ